MPTRNALWGLFTHKPRWSLSMRGWLVIIAGLIAVAATLLFRIHPFLAVNRPVAADTLIVEGWISDGLFPGVVEEFKRGTYEHAITTGGPVNWTGASKYGGTYAGYCAMRLQRAGFKTNAVIAVPSNSADWQRTYHAALAVRAYITTNKLSPSGVNIITVGPHARRTRLLYQRAMGDKVPIGIIALSRDDYDPQRWWRSSTGLREVIGELAGYIYCRAVPSAFTEP